jgi:transcriptional regulator GlxA family with amidase domain
MRLETVMEQVMEQPDGATRRLNLGHALLTSMQCPSLVDPAVLAGIKWLSRRPHGRIVELSRWIGISERQLHRRFSAAVGYGPKMFQSVLRFQRLLNTARETAHSLADLAAIAGYADQAHMSRDVHRLAGLPPTMLFR